MIYEMPGAVLEYEWKMPESENAASEVEITGYRGTKGELRLPEQIDGHPVTGIGKKAFFNSSGLYRIYIPGSVCSVGDWAFSHCKDLEEVFFRRKQYEFGKAVFLECDDLKRICILDEDSEKLSKEEEAEIFGFGALLAATCGILDAPYLFRTDIRDEAEWLALWDARMFSILHEDDMEGYTKLLLCGEEDYGSKENNLDYFLTEKRRRKVRLAFLRLLYHNRLKAEDEAELKAYLLEHTAGCESTETWLVLKEEHADDTAYISLFLELGCVSSGNFDEMLTDLSEEHPQLKTYLLRYKEEKLGGADFFAGLDLDL